jgi:hypothetical protein
MRALCSTVLLLVIGCEDGAVGSGGGASTGSGTASGPSGTGPGSTATGQTGTGASSTSTGSAGGEPCPGTTLADLTRISTHPIAGATGAKALYAESPSGGYVAWAAGDGVHVTPLDANDAPAGSDLVVAAAEPFGLAVDGDVFLLASRAPDFMTFFRIGTDGSVVASADLVGGGDHQVEGVEWFGEFARTGRLVRTAPNTFAAYFALHRRWPDGIGHQGDTLRLLDENGSPLGGGWGWGCSHSMDQLLTTSASTLAPICISDCYPQKGIWFGHDQSMLIDDASANCAGGYSTILGGIAGVPDGFWITFGKQGANGYDMQLAHLDQNGAVISTSPLGASPTGASRLAPYDGGLLLGAFDGATTTLQRLDLAGNPAGAAESPAGLALPTQDFVGLANGEAAWARTSGSSLEITRVRACR